MGFKFREPLVLIEGPGLIISPSSTDLFGNVSPSQTTTISLPQDLSTTSNVTFNQITPGGKLIIGSNALIFASIFSGAQIETDETLSNLLIHSGILTTTANLTTTGNLTIKGTTTAKKIETEISQSLTLFESGSSQFGDTFDDTHQFSGSFSISGSIALSENVTVREISNDTTLTDNSTVALVTENAVKNYLDDITDGITTYLRKCFVHTGSFVDSSTSTFTAITASAPTSLSSTSESDFMFFINGQMMEHDALTVQQSGTTFTLNLNTTSLGYDLVSDDEIVAWGKFNS